MSNNHVILPGTFKNPVCGRTDKLIARGRYFPDFSSGLKKTKLTSLHHLRFNSKAAYEINFSCGSVSFRAISFCTYIMDLLRPNRTLTVIAINNMIKKANIKITMISFDQMDSSDSIFLVGRLPSFCSGTLSSSLNAGSSLPFFIRWPLSGLPGNLSRS
ncbi:Hypothetical predicted protein [Mytilus galloprovincialis]|uniref:Uncharacterized protein n=1 Tax=Mytilus galloprovincialis TaxID=29158 RepID=A0A8B6F5T1_MYTGA|nr:Hypothetical predicted protein [Mytilus galloprovincialis]